MNRDIQPMKPGIAVGSLTLLLVGCSPSDPCQEHADQASCEAAKACIWHEKKSKCKTGDARVPAPTTETVPTPPPVPKNGASPAPEPNVVPEPTSPPEPNVVPEPTSPPEPPVAEPTPPEPPSAEPAPPSPPPPNDQ
jgi:hypothetical protein